MAQRAQPSPVDRLFGALANPTRRDILGLLLDGPQTVSAIAERYEMARPSVSEHLRVLREAGLVTETRHGRFRHIEIAPGPLRDLHDWMTPYERFWRERLRDMHDVLDREAAAEDR
ncbi:ArsR/SmtB family transcription factor [Conexibacter woesei]|uniref:Transcriptional regulator, ArsR family n=1 Tax=Conexibacter woesei (strain DSM 14684 / CCUG 47730 / CIP 108061 / JCM 11494 / NBRC 100937 / ID131577) TaxID=469383 RepID=D3F6H5_CONWI|nr:metalloregulator ArsR/SmtB family transcription factor [Conexibacter woesei]ADB50742.1 transcriptional regulator, ArsR family [Conexibacter woesei DSM 14684]